MLDATKAFDRVHFIKLFQLLITRKICPLICRLLIIQYTLQLCRMKYCDSMSDLFKVSNGVKQGGVLSPLLFTVYVDELLSNLAQTGFGCHIGNMFTGALCYADDIMLLAPTRFAMRKMIDVCTEFSKNFNIIFNHKKTTFIYFGDSLDIMPFAVDGNLVSPVKNDKHLGYRFGMNAFETEITQAVSNLYMNVNNMLSKFSKANIDVKYQLFKSFCMSVFGSQLWDFESKECEKFFTAWRKCIRRLLNVPNQCHSKLLPLLCLDTSIQSQLHTRFIKFVNSCRHSENKTVQICMNEALNNHMSHRCRSLSKLCHLYGFTRSSSCFDTKAISNHFFTHIDENDLADAMHIRELIYYKDKMKDNDVNAIIEFLCVS